MEVYILSKFAPVVEDHIPICIFSTLVFGVLVWFLVLGGGAGGGRERGGKQQKQSNDISTAGF